MMGKRDASEHKHIELYMAFPVVYCDTTVRSGAWSSSLDANADVALDTHHSFAAGVEQGEMLHGVS